MDIKDLSIAIVGAGYAGAAVAKALSSHGAEVTVYEQASEIREVGAGIGLRPSSMAQFERWGIGAEIKAVSSASDAFEILTADDHRIAQEEWPEKAAYGETTHLIHRGDFIEALTGVLPDGMVKLGHKLDKIVDEGDAATLVFANGETATADLVIGADGIKSIVREQLFSQAGPVFAGEHAYRVVIDIAETAGMVDDGNLRMYIGRGTKVYLLPLLHRGQVSFDITALSTDGTWAPEVTKADILRTVEGFDERIVRMTENLDLAKVNVRAVYDIDPVEQWHTGAVVLVGDAAHAMCHHQGQGANSAILDAAALVDALVEAGSVAEALAAYQAARKPVTDELQRISRQGWTDDELDDVFPGQKPGGIAATTQA
ncbi:MAG TPA: FAD-dependent monooxygenase [Nocardioides sp.]|uniref:FAD-dependent monooxygenase n=1 Tax=Nocardioides sp. TaxID=35761 RepID=UPI002C914523|nr:FAD-dependent monooxygenase [Nocardioides sp.]HTW15591.1 FAD-dependent monooxygenase [Nocardioides sp.]